MYRYAVVFIISAILSFAFTPFAKKLANKFGAIDIPKDDRRIHKEPIPRMGGLAIYLAFSIVALYFSKFDKSVSGIILGGTILVIMGIMDDMKPMRPLHKLLFQILAAAVLISFDINVKSITVPFVSSDSVYVGHIGTIITILWVVGITNAINLIDGVDGLACGICLISALTLLGVSIISQREMAIFLTTVLAGSCLGFLPFNFNPASVFMGDTGSQFLGFILAAISIQGAIKSAAAVAVVVPILALGLPIYDTLFAMIRRKINKRPIMEADRGHLHHRLLDMGYSQRKVVFVMYLISAFLGAISIVAMTVSTRRSFELLVLVCLVTLAIAIEIGLFGRKKTDKEV